MPALQGAFSCTPRIQCLDKNRMRNRKIVMAVLVGETLPHGEACAQMSGSEFKKSGSCGGENGRKSTEKANGKKAREERANPLLRVLITIPFFNMIPNHILIHVTFHFFISGTK